MQYESLRAAAEARGLLASDAEWHRCLLEARGYCHPAKLRELFVCIIVNSEPSNPATLWEDHKEALSEDFLHRARQVCH